MKNRLTWIMMVAMSLVLLTGCDDDDNGVAEDDRSVQIVANVTAQNTQANDLSGLSYASDGSIYVSGYVGSPDDDEDLQLAVGRYDADGNPDQTFGTNGFVTQNIAAQAGGSSGEEGSLAVVELENGDVIVAVNAADGNTANGDEGTNAYLLRLDDSGDVVTTFGTNGMVEIEFGTAGVDDDAFADANGFYPEASISDLQVDNSGTEQRIVVFGVGTAEDGTTRTDQDRYITRVLASDGSVDPDFNGGDYYTYDSNGSFGDNSRRGMVEDDGTIVSAGYTDFGAGLDNHIILIRLLEDGTPDPDFGNFIVPAGNVTEVERPGVAAFNPYLTDEGFAECYAVLRQSDGGFVTAGYGAATGGGITSSFGYQTTTGPDVVTFRVFSGEDDVDDSYGNPDAPGTQTIQSEGEGRPSTEDRGRDAVALDDDTAVFVGYFGGIASAYFFTPDGVLDTRVDDDGIMELGHPSNGSQFYAAAVNGTRIAMTTRDDIDDGSEGARLVILDVIDE